MPSLIETMSGTAIIIGQPETCVRVEQQLNLLAARPVTIGWVLTDDAERTRCPSEAPALGTIHQLEAIVAQRKPAVALLCLPAVMTNLIRSLRTRLRRLGIPDRFFPTLEDLMQGVGPRSTLTIDMNELLDRPPRRIDEDSIRRLIAGRRVLITGAGGSIGSELARLSARFNPGELILFERSENALFEIDRQIARFQPQLTRRAVLHDIVNEGETLYWFLRLKPEIVFHAAAHKHVPMMEDHPAAAVENNLFGTKSVVDAAIESQADRLVMISTDKAVNPRSIMGATKRLAEMYIQQVQPGSRTAFSIVRFGNVLGSAGSVIDIWARQIAEGGPVTVTDPRMTRYFMTIDEAAALVMQAAALARIESDEPEVFVLNMGRPERILDLARRMIELHGLRPIMPNGQCEARGQGRHDRAGSIPIVFTGQRPGEKIHEELAHNGDSLKPTRHPDINIWASGRIEPQYMDTIMERFKKLRRIGRSEEVAALIRMLIPDIRKPVAA